MANLVKVKACKIACSKACKVGKSGVQIHERSHVYIKEAINEYKYIKEAINKRNQRMKIEKIYSTAVK